MPQQPGPTSTLLAGPFLDGTEQAAGGIAGRTGRDSHATLTVPS